MAHIVRVEISGRGHIGTEVWMSYLHVQWNWIKLTFQLHLYLLRCLLVGQRLRCLMILHLLLHRHQVKSLLVLIGQI